MELKLAENIKRMRKEKGLTQEAMADALGVTVGAVYKWEADLSSPELQMLVRLAELFDTSVDVLLGYKAADNRKQAIIDRIYEYSAKKDPKAIEEAEMALAKYPNDYWVISAAANIYSNFGIEEKDRDRKKIRKAIELYEKASRIVPHDVNPKYGKLMLQGNIATLYYFLDETDKALEMLKDHNEAGVFDTKIASITAMRGDTSEDFRTMLINTFWESNSNIINITFSLLMFYKNSGDLSHMKTLARWAVDYVNSMRKTNDACFLDKLTASFLAAESYACLKSGEKDKAMSLLKEAKERADLFDQTQNFSTDIIKLFDNCHEGTLIDTLGKTAHESIEKLIALSGDRKFASMWKDLGK